MRNDAKPEVAAWMARRATFLTDEQKEAVETKLAEGLSLVEELAEVLSAPVDTVGELEDAQTEATGILSALESIVADTEDDGPIFNPKPKVVVSFNEVLYRLNGRFQGGVKVRKNTRDPYKIRIGKPRSPIYSDVYPGEVVNIARELGVIGKRDEVCFYV